LRSWTSRVFKEKISAPKWRKNAAKAPVATFTQPMQSTRFTTGTCKPQSESQDSTGTHRFDAPVPLHKVSQHMQKTIAQAQHQQKREKVTCNPQSYIARAN
jgi:hypothetical protein